MADIAYILYVFAMNFPETFFKFFISFALGFEAFVCTILFDDGMCNILGGVQWLLVSATSALTYNPH